MNFIRIVRRACLPAALLLSACAHEPIHPPIAVKASQVIPIKQTDRGVLILMPTEKVYFDSGKATVSRVEANEFIDRVAALLKDKTTANIVLEGHTDSQGGRDLNQGLSEERASTIRKMLAERGVAASRMTTQGFAFDRPVAPNDTEAGRQANRRVELTILGEKVENITRGEPEGSFEEAFGRLKSVIDQGGLAPAGSH